ncbi:aminotransferase class III-fold pyridoxal phosphate-dependent enzyme [Aestuariivivens sp. NBU2969]|uniref:aminotransferase class III-fold pyridoxal phosphate-dependent enzyme n=1 Tax=Aestuariivivens sp. NBU2969 TaxID=2873267 RepID=UPI001CBE32B7|nr:aminotransferase class III-fold pyridoxal phosphate-dependent enzyme [Aestuariivivens sp. NBU2969]
MQESHNTSYTKPYLQELLSILKLDKEFHHAKGNYLYSDAGQEQVKYLDLAGGYGSLLLGHNHPDLIRTAQELLGDHVCAHHQLSKKSKLDALCHKINDLIGSQTRANYTTMVLNSGTEAVEAAIKHAMLAFYNKLMAIDNDLSRELMNIQESFFNTCPQSPLMYNDYEIHSIEALRSLMQSLNKNSNTYRPKIVASNKSFHGKTLGALSVTSNQAFRMPFLRNAPFETIYLDINTECPEVLFKENEIEISIPKVFKDGKLVFKTKTFNLIAAAILEPIIGEGGIHVVSKEFLTDLRRFTKAYNIPLIFDEIQCGCFRTGPFLASFHHKVSADYYILGKSLGGGLAKISAVAIEKRLYIPEFDVLHSSTFAEDDYSTVMAHKSLELLEKNCHRIPGVSACLFDALVDLQNRYPQIIREVRGLGLMIGIRFESMDYSTSFGLQGISRSNYFGYVLSAYLLNEKHIRVSVTLSDPKTLRLLPSLFMDKAEINQCIEALEELCKILMYGDFYALISFLLPKRGQHLRPVSDFNPQRVKWDEMDGSMDEVGFLLHYIDVHTIRAYLPSLDILPEDLVLYLIERLSPFSEPVVIGRNRIKDAAGREICISFVGLSFTAKMIIDDMRESMGNIIKYQGICNKGIDLLYHLGITKIGLGQYNSMIMQNGKAITNPDIRVTTGNGYTAFTVVQKVYEAIINRKGQSTKLAVIGAGGNIAKVLSTMVADQCDKMLLLGRFNGNPNKLIDHAGFLIQEILKDLAEGKAYDNVIYDQINRLDMDKGASEHQSSSHYVNIWNAYTKQFESDKKIEIGMDLNRLRDCDVILVATSDPTSFLNRAYLKKGAFICDISVPLNCEKDLLEDKDFQVVKGGIVRLVNGENLYPPGLFLEDGQAFACMAETMLMGFEHDQGPYSFGEISKALVIALGNRVLNHGFIEGAQVKEMAD